MHVNNYRPKNNVCLKAYDLHVGLEKHVQCSQLLYVASLINCVLLALKFCIAVIFKLKNGVSVVYRQYFEDQ